jgi:hypothetical protein
MPYNIEADLCDTPTTPPVQLKLADANCTVLHRQYDSEAPYFLWGNNGSDVFRNRKPLPNGGYYLSSKIDGRTKTIRFTQSCAGQGPGKTFGKVCARPPAGKRPKGSPPAGKQPKGKRRFPANESRVQIP